MEQPLIEHDSGWAAVQNPEIGPFFVIDFELEVRNFLISEVCTRGAQ